MPRMAFLLSVLLICLSYGAAAAQTSAEPQQGDPPVAALISVSEPDEDGVVTIRGAAGAVFPAAQVAIRNLYTGDTVYVGAGITGSFSAQIYGPGPTPFMVSPAASIPAALRDRPDSLPGGPATIIRAANPTPDVDPTQVAMILIDGETEDWSRYPDARLAEGVLALASAESLYLGLGRTVPQTDELAIILILDGITYELIIEPTLPQAALLRQVAPRQTDPVTVSVAVAASADAIELRLPLAGIDPQIETITLEQVFVRSGDEAVDVQTYTMPVPVLDLQDGIVYPGGRLEGATRFFVAGTLARGAGRWMATGRINRSQLAPGDELIVEMDFRLEAPDLPFSLTGLNILGDFSLQPVVIDEVQSAAALDTNNGWSNLLTPSGLAIDNVRGDVYLGRAAVPAPQVIQRPGELRFGIRFNLTVPPQLPRGLYVPVFEGLAQIGDGEVFRWQQNGIFGQGGREPQRHLDRLPVVLNIGAVDSSRLPMTLLYDHPSDGSRGILPDEDMGRIALSNRVRFNSQTYTLPPGEYPLEPYLLNQMPNAYDRTSAPLLPLLFPGGRLQAVVTAPDGTRDELADAPIIQNRLSTAALDERTRFGGQVPVDVFRLVTATLSYQGYTFNQYGRYTINLTGSVEDVSGNRYTGGGAYSLLIAELLDLTPGVLPGTPFTVGDTFFPGGRVQPRFPADVGVTLTIYPLDGEQQEVTFDMVADAGGYFAPADDVDAFVFDQAGEYIIDYEARYTDAEGRLWAASLRSAGVIAGGESTLIAHGARGINGLDDAIQPPWFSTAVYPALEQLSTAPPRPNYPYFAGDVALTPDTRDSGIRAVMQIQDLAGTYADWLLANVSDQRLSGGLTLERLAVIDALPPLPVVGGSLTAIGPALLPDLLVNSAYYYASAVRPDVTVRQFVGGQVDDGLPLYWDNDDPLNGQIGAGADGNQRNDYVFLFGGMVLRNAEAGVRTVMPYASLAVTIDSDNPAGVYPPYRGVGGPDRNALIILDDNPIDTFFHPTAVQPGQVLPLGAVHVLTGQAGPPLESAITARITAPSGEVRIIEGITNSLGYYYDPSQNFILDETGIWTVELLITPMTAGSNGALFDLPVGSVPGVDEMMYRLYVLPEESTPLDWSLNGDVDESYNSGTPLNVTVAVPDDWRQTRVRAELTTAAYVMQTTPLQVFATSASFQYNPFTLSEDFPIEASGDGTGPSGSDVVTLTFVATGIGPDDRPRIATRTLTILHDRIISTDTQTRGPDEPPENS